MTTPLNTQNEESDDTHLPQHNVASAVLRATRLSACDPRNSPPPLTSMSKQLFPGKTGRSQRAVHARWRRLDPGCRRRRGQRSPGPVNRP